MSSISAWALMKSKMMACSTVARLRSMSVMRSTAKKPFLSAPKNRPAAIAQGVGAAQQRRQDAFEADARRELGDEAPVRAQDFQPAGQPGDGAADQERAQHDTPRPHPDVAGKLRIGACRLQLVAPHRALQ